MLQELLASGGDNSGQIGACAISGCTDPTATNYNALATIDDSSCTYCLLDNVTLTLSEYIQDLVLLTTVMVLLILLIHQLLRHLLIYVLIYQYVLQLTYDSTESWSAEN